MKQLLTITCLVVGCLLSVGCQSIQNTKESIVNKVDLKSGIPWKSDKKPAGIPVRVAAVWTDAVHHTAGKSERGFGGRLFFYGPTSNDPIRVDGQLVVYAFDEAGRKQSDNCPTKRYVFPPEQWAKHYSESDNGHSYSVWLPWDKAGGKQAKVSLIARFEPREGTVVASNQATQFLSGSLLASEPQPSTEPLASVIQKVSHEETNASAEKSTQEKQRMTTTTIHLP